MKAALLVLLLAVTGWRADAQTTPTFENSGNGLLKGTYYFREVAYVVGDNSGSLNDALAVYGTLTFSGTGTYAISSTVADAAQQSLGQLNTSGTYSISASGYGFMSSPISNGDTIYGLVSKQGIFTASSTENGFFNDLLIAAPLASPLPVNSSFKGSYWISDIDLSSGSPLGALGMLFQLNPDGAGNLGSVAVTGYQGQGGSTAFSQTIQPVRYAFSNGAASLTFPNTQGLAVSGQKFMYISPDGSFVFGGSPTGFDMFVGVRVSTSGTPNLSGLYYQAGIDEDDSNLSLGFGDLDTYFGSFNANGGNVVSHQRVADVFNPSFSVDATFIDTYTVKSDGTYSTPSMRYAVGDNGIRIGSGIGPFLGLNVALPAPGLSGTGVFLNPQGVVNAASFAPFTAGIAPGELLTLFGSNLSNDGQIASSVPLPTTLGGVQVMINGIAAPILYAFPGQISAIVPYAATTPIIQIQVINNGSPSNTVTNFTSLTAPGIFTNPIGGTGIAAALHTDYSLVTSDHPAAIGETISVFLTGLGAVTPTVTDGAAGPTDTFAITNNTITAYVGGVKASIGYSGLAPGSAASYQINLTIPTGVTAGSNILSIVGPDTYSSEAIVPAAASSDAAAAPPPPGVGSRMRTPAAPLRGKRTTRGR